MRSVEGDGGSEIRRTYNDTWTNLGGDINNRGRRPRTTGEENLAGEENKQLEKDYKDKKRGDSGSSALEKAGDVFLTIGGHLVLFVWLLECMGGEWHCVANFLQSPNYREDD